MNDRKKKVYKQRFRQQWMQSPLLKGWLQPAPSPDKVYCTYCKASLIAHYRALIRHSKSTKHKEYASQVNSLSSSINNMEFITIGTDNDLQSGTDLTEKRTEKRKRPSDTWSFLGAAGTKPTTSFRKKIVINTGTGADDELHVQAAQVLDRETPVKTAVITVTPDIQIDLNKPLSDSLRPKTLQDFIGQEEVLGSSSLLRSSLVANKIPNMIFWGPPGCGKTTLASIIGQQCRLGHSKRFTTLPSCTVGVQDVRNILREAKTHLQVGRRQTVLFIDEIHRFSKAQQDLLLPHIESGLVTLIGATTENPSLSLTSSLLSRCQVIALKPLSPKSIRKIMRKALSRLNIGVVQELQAPEESFTYSSSEEQSLDADFLGVIHQQISLEALRWLSESCNGDARVALNTLQLLVSSKIEGPVLLHHAKAALQRAHLHDQNGEGHYDYASALQKAIHGCDDNAALYWTMRMIQAGEDPEHIARKLVRIAAEDIGLGDLNALNVAMTTLQAVRLLGMPESDVVLCQCAVYLARTHHNSVIYQAMLRIKEHFSAHPGQLPPVPLHLRNLSSELLMNFGYGQDSLRGLGNLPEELRDIKFLDIQ